MNEKRVIALGFFDGVHLGHAALLRRARQRAEELGAEACLLTFDSHPDELVSGVKVELLNSPEDRAYIASHYFGIEQVLTVHFDEAMMHMPWRDFADGVLRDYGAVHFVVGDDFRFGYRGEGTAEKLHAYAIEKGYGCDVIEKVELDGVVVSSTYIRTLVAEGNVEEAGRFLGHPHLLTGPVLHGFRLGRKLGTPTINQRFEPGVLVPRHGVYAARVRLLDEAAYWPAVTNIGVRPTVGGEDAVSVVGWLLGNEGNAYDRPAVCELYAFLRPERKFDSLEALSGQIHADAARVPEVLRQYGLLGGEEPGEGGPKPL